MKIIKNENKKKPIGNDNNRAYTRKTKWKIEKERQKLRCTSSEEKNKENKDEEKKRFQEYFHFEMPVKFYGNIFEGMHTMHILANE